MTTDMTTKAIYAFDDAGMVKYTLDWPWSDAGLEAIEASEQHWAILERLAPHDYWMDTASEGKACHVRAACSPSLSKARIRADGEDAAVLSGLPDPCTVVVDGEAHSVEGGSFELASTSAGTHVVSLGGPHRSEPMLLEAVDLGQHRDAKKAEINAARSVAMATSPTSLGFTFDSKPEDKINISGIVTGIMAVGIESHPDIPFRLADNTLETFTPAQFVQASLEVSGHLAAVYARSWALKAHVDGLEDLDAIDAVTWETEVP
jgi:hypothetical protein